jgi:hypothetical protein
MANRNDQREKFNYLESLYFQDQANRSGGSIARHGLPPVGPGAGWMAMMGGVPNVTYGGQMAPTRSDVLLAGAANRRDNNPGYAAFNAREREKARMAGGPGPFDPSRFMPQQYGGMPQYMPGNQMPMPGGYPRKSGKPEPTLQEKLAQSYLDQINAANAKNEERYDQGLGLAIGARDRNMERIAALGAQGSADIREDYDKAGKAAYSDLVGRGLAGSTVTSAVAGNNLKEQTKSLARHQDYITRQQIDTDAGLSRNIQDFIERRNDVAPDVNQLIALSQGLGQGNNGMGYGYNPQTQGLYQTGGSGMLAYGQPNQLLAGTPSTGTGMGNDMRTLPAQQQQWQPQVPQQFTPGGAGMNFGYGRGYGPQPNQYAAYGGKMNAQQLGARPTVNYAAAAQYENSLKAPVQQQQSGRYTPQYGGGGRALQTMPAPQFVNAGNMFAIPGASYGMQGGGSAYGFGGSRYMGAPAANAGGQPTPGQRQNFNQLQSAFNPIHPAQVGAGANQLGQWMGQASNYLGRLF